MCLTCGCDEPDRWHGRPENITTQDLERAAAANGMSVDEAARNLQASIHRLATRVASGRGGAARRRVGLRR